MSKTIIASPILLLFCLATNAQTEAPKPPTATDPRVVAPKAIPPCAVAPHALSHTANILVSPSAPTIYYTGRIENSNPACPTFTYPGIEIRTAFTGNHISMIAKPHSGYFMVKIDDTEPFKIAFLNDSIQTIYDSETSYQESPESNNKSHDSNKENNYSDNENSSSPESTSTHLQEVPTNTHQLTITYISEGYQSFPEFHGFLLNKSTSLATPSPLPTRKIEFIGNSITCGYGIEANDPSAPYTEETANYYYTYAAQTARNLNAQTTVVARSGIGVYRNYNGPQTGDAVNMNTEYSHTLLYNDNYKWDFTLFTPDVVCINLGTNDTSTTGADSTLLTQGFINLYKQVRYHYSQAKIILLSGCMMQGHALSTAKQAMDNTQLFAKEHGDHQVYRLDFLPHDGSLGYGASWHPSMKQHTQMAKQLTAYLQKLMKWN